MPRETKNWRVYARADSGVWQVQWGGRGAAREPLGVPADRPRAEAEGEAARRWVAGGGKGKLSAAAAGPLAGISVAELVPLYVEQAEAMYRGKDPTYASRKATDLSEYVATRWTLPGEVTADAWKVAMTKLHHKNHGPLRWRSIAHLAHTLRGFLTWCHEKGIIQEVPVLEVPGAKEQRIDSSQRRAFTEDEMEAFLWALAIMGEGRALRIYLVLFETWQRKSTIGSMTLRWVDFTHETITIPAKHFKTGVEKVIDLTPRCADAIREELAQVQNIDPDRPIFGQFNFHQAWNDKRNGGVFGRAVTMAGIDRHGLTAHHVTRHTAATLALGSGVSILGAMAQGGWDSMQSMERYTHQRLEQARQAARVRVVAR